MLVSVTDLMRKKYSVEGRNVRIRIQAKEEMFSAVSASWATVGFEHGLTRSTHADPHGPCSDDGAFC